MSRLKRLANLPALRGLLFPAAIGFGTLFLLVAADRPQWFHLPPLGAVDLSMMKALAR